MSGGIIGGPIATRLINVYKLKRAEGSEAPAGAQLVRALGGVARSVTLLIVVLIAWVVVPMTVGTISLIHQDLQDL